MEDYSIFLTIFPYLLQEEKKQNEVVDEYSSSSDDLALAPCRATLFREGVAQRGYNIYSPVRAAHACSLKGTNRTGPSSFAKAAQRVCRRESIIQWGSR